MVKIHANPHGKSIAKIDYKIVLLNILAVKKLEA